eukprot:1457401-Pleurochrysis_carterae.AAC.4
MKTILNAIASPATRPAYRVQCQKSGCSLMTYTRMDTTIQSPPPLSANAGDPRGVLPPSVRMSVNTTLMKCSLSLRLFTPMT